jgi:CRISPR/Cas system-associated protein endoribonuclease Cas2
VLPTPDIHFRNVRSGAVTLIRVIEAQFHYLYIWLGPKQVRNQRRNFNEEKRPEVEHTLTANT